jgi:hypothetical protein
MKNYQKRNKIEKVMAFQSKRGQELKKQTTKCYKDKFPNIKKKNLYVVLLLLEFKDDL